VLDAFTLSQAGIMQRLAVVERGLLVADAAGFKIIGWPGNKSRVS